jgi:hypothetical protein
MLGKCGNSFRTLYQASKALTAFFFSYIQLLAHIESNAVITGTDWSPFPDQVRPVGLTILFGCHKMSASMNRRLAVFQSWLRVAAPLVISVILALSVFGKLSPLDQFVRVLSKTFGITSPLDRILAILVIGFELSTAIALLVPKWRNPGTSACTVLILCFISFHVLKWIDKVPVPCLCFGAMYKVQPLYAVLMSTAMLVANEYAKNSSDINLISENT